jgi:hypothetical protein
VQVKGNSDSRESGFIGREQRTPRAKYETVQLPVKSDLSPLLGHDRNRMLVPIFSIEDPGVDGIFPSGLFCVISNINRSAISSVMSATQSGNAVTSIAEPNIAKRTITG